MTHKLARMVEILVQNPQNNLFCAQNNPTPPPQPPPPQKKLKFSEMMGLWVGRIHPHPPENEKVTNLGDLSKCGDTHVDSKSVPPGRVPSNFSMYCATIDAYICMVWCWNITQVRMFHRTPNLEELRTFGQ